MVVLVVAVAACSSTSEPTKTYDASACNYDGPTEFDLTNEVTFTFLNESTSRSVGFVVWTVPDGSE